MKKQKSVTRLMLLIIAGGILFFSLFICFIVNSRLNQGLVEYLGDEIKGQSVVFRHEMEENMELAEDTARWVQDQFSEVYKTKGYDRATMNLLAEYARKYFHAQNIVFFNKFGMQLSSPKYGVVPKTPVIAEALKGKETIRYDKTGGNIYGTVILPLKSDDEIFGVVEVRSVITTFDLVNTLSTYLNSEITIFNDAERMLTTLEGLEGTELDDRSIIERAEKGESTTLTNVINGKKYISHFFPFHDQNGNFLCTIFIGKDFDVATELTMAIFMPL